MAEAPDYYVFDGDSGSSVVPRRPGVDDVGGAAKLDDQDYPPDPQTMPTAAEDNQQERILVGLAKVAALAYVHVKFSGGTPSVFAVVAPSFALTTSDFTITDNGAGDTSVVPVANKIPIQSLPPRAWAAPSGTGEYTAHVRVVSTIGARVETRLAGTLTDCDFVVEFI